MSYEQKLANRPGFYSVLRTSNGVDVRVTKEFDSLWAEAAISERPINFLLVQLSMVEVRAHGSAALPVVEKSLGAGSAVANTSVSPVRNMFKIRVSGLDVAEIEALNTSVSDPYVLCEDESRVPRRY